jgi:xanthine dehydrogenase YagS FAD-binding subunit
MRDFAHHDVQSINEAIRLLVAYKGKAILNAGGTDLLSVLKGDILPDYPEALVNIKTIPDLDYIRMDGDGVKIGALTRLCALCSSPLLTPAYSVLTEAAFSVAGPQIRNVATLGGNLCQDVRCWYYRYPSGIGGPIPCARKGKGACLAVKGDNRYHAILNGKKCFAVCPSDTAVALEALDARIIVSGPDGDRAVSPADFFTPLRNALGPSELVREIEIPARTAVSQQRFLKFTLRKPIDFAIVSVASVLTIENGVCIGARIVLGAVAPGPLRVPAAEEVLVGRPISAELAQTAAKTALIGARPLGKNAYKIQVAQTLVKRAILGESE